MGAPDLSGVVLDGRYQVVERLSQGAMGVVYRGLRVQLNRAVAIKVMHSSLPGAMAGRERFERETKLMALLEHPHCVSVIDYGLYKNKPYVVMELVRGRSLHDLLVEQHCFEVPRAADIMRQVLSGLAHAHEQGIIHRDIKPANIMITPTAPLGVHARILDFGLARLVESSTSLTDGVAVGTPSYMAPEQCRGGVLDARVDLYACGVMLFEMVTGRKPFVAADPIAIVKMQLDAPPPRLADVAGGEFGELEGVVARALAKSPHDRFTSAVAMSEAIDAAVTGGRGASEATAAFGALAAEPSSERIGSSALVPLDASIDVPISVQLPTPSDASTGRIHDASILRRMVPASRMRWAVVVGIVLAGAAIYVVTTREPGDTVALDAGMRTPSIELARPAPVPAADAIEIVVASASELATAGKLDAALDVIAKARREHGEQAALAYAAGKIYFAKLWWNDGIKNLREAIKLAPAYRDDPELIKTAIRGFISTPELDERLGGFVAELGSAAAPFLDETARMHPNPAVRRRATAELRRLR